VGYSPYRKFRARTADYVMLVLVGLIGVLLVAWAFAG
jgi:multisubunit Na+/H+ antiporter MnhB subunit